MVGGSEIRQIEEREREERYNAFNKSANDRKRVLYWIGFLEGALSSRHIEDGEQAALMAESEKFADFFDDPDASDLAEDIRSRCFSSEKDMMVQLREIITDKSNELADASTSKETDELNIFLGFCAGVICDGRVLEPEVRAIRERFMKSERLREEVAFNPLCKAVEEALADDVITEEESKDIEEWLSQLVGDGYADTGFTNIGNVAKLDDPILDPEAIELENSVFVLTGAMRMGPRAFIEKEIIRAGGVMAPRATRKVDYVVVSSTASRHWRTTHFGTKIERARELIEEGYKLRFVSEVALEKALSAKG
ncbi:MAG: hypothetical protein ACQETX_00630 [Pseudomonadota bacterium]